MNDWGQQDEQSNLQYRDRGLSNVYSTDNVEPPKEFFTIYNSNASVKSRVISIGTIVAVIIFCGVLFMFLYRDTSDYGKASPDPMAQSKVK